MFLAKNDFYLNYTKERAEGIEFSSVKDVKKKGASSFPPSSGEAARWGGWIDRVAVETGLPSRSEALVLIAAMRAKWQLGRAYRSRAGRRSMNLKSNETEIVGVWTLVDRKILADEACMRIDHLVAHILQEVAIDPHGWDRLYRDPADGRLWQCYYPQSHLHGGGPPTLICLTDQEARAKYEF